MGLKSSSQDGRAALGAKAMGYGTPVMHHKLRVHVLELAAYAMVQGAQYKGREREGRRVFLLFECAKNYEQLRQEFYGGAQGTLVAYHSALQAAKELIFDND